MAMSVKSDAACLAQLRMTSDVYVTGPSTGTLFGYPTSSISAAPTLRRNGQVSIETEDPLIGRAVLRAASVTLVARASSELTPTSREVTRHVSRVFCSSVALGRGAGIWRLVTFEGQSGSDVVDGEVIS